MEMFTYGQPIPSGALDSNNISTSTAFLPASHLTDRLLGIYRCTLTEELVRQNVDFCRAFIENQILDRSQPNKIPILIVSCVLLLIGLIGNILVVLSVAVFPGMRSRTNLFLMNLAISDMLIFLICLPLTIYHLVQLRWVFGAALCKLTPFLQGLSISVSVWSVASLSVKRYVVVRYPMSAKQALTNCRMAIWHAGIWLISVLVCSPIPMVYALKEERVFWLLSVHSCVEDWYSSPARKTTYTIFIFGMLYLLPLMAMSVFSWKLSRQLVNTARFARCQPSQAVSRGRVKASKVVMALLVVFAVCWLPYHVVNILIDLRHYSQPSSLNATVIHGENGTNAAEGGADDNQLVATALPVALLMGYANSAINPVCLAIISSKFKACFVCLITLRCFKERHTLVARVDNRAAGTDGNGTGYRSSLHDRMSMQSRRQHQQQPSQPPIAEASEAAPLPLTSAAIAAADALTADQQDALEAQPLGSLG